MNSVFFRMYNKIRNLGDAINPFIINRVSGAEPVYTRRVDTPHLLGIGSISFYGSPRSHLWGTGVLSPGKGGGRSVPLQNIHALRGELSKRYFFGSKAQHANIPLGDPGFLVKKYYPYKSVRKRYKACIIPHHGSFFDIIFDDLKARDDVCVLNLMSYNILELDKIAASEVVLSQSLHGLIFAEAFDVPSVWISSRFDDNWKFKFRDWYSTTQEPVDEPFSVCTKFQDLCSAARLSNSLINMDRLVDSFPHDVISTKSSNSFIGFSESLNVDVHKVFCDIPALPLRKKEVDHVNAERLRVKINQVVNGFFKSYSIPGYAIVGSNLDLLASSLLSKVAELMDQKYKFSFCFITTSTVKHDEKFFRINGLIITKNTYTGSRLIVRPNDVFDFSGEFLTVHI